MRRLLLRTLFLHSGLLAAWTAMAGAVTWTNAGSTGLWGDAGNWSPAGVPGTADVVTFSSASTANCTINVNAAVKGVLVQSGFTGALIQGAGRTLTVGNSNFVQQGGTFQGSNADLLMVSGNLILSGGTFIAPSGTLSIGGQRTANAVLFNHSGGSFQHNGGTVSLAPSTINGSGNFIWTVDVHPSTVFHDLVVNCQDLLRQTTMVAPAGDVLQVRNDLHHLDGTLHIPVSLERNLVVGSAANAGTGTITFMGTTDQRYRVISGAPRTCPIAVNKSSGVVQPEVGTTTFLTQGFSMSQGVFIAPSVNFGVGGTWTVGRTLFGHTGGTYIHNDGVLTVDPYNTQATTLTWTLDVMPTTALYDVVINAYDQTTPSRLETGVGDEVTAERHFTHADGQLFGRFAVKGEFRIAMAAGGGTGTVRIIGTTDQFYQCSSASARTCVVVVDKAAGTMKPVAGTTTLPTQGFHLRNGAFTAPTGNLSAGGAWAEDRTLFHHEGGTFLHNNGTVRIDPATTGGAARTWTMQVLPSTRLRHLHVAAVDQSAQSELVVAPAGAEVVAEGNFNQYDGRVTANISFGGNLMLAAASNGTYGRLTANGSADQTYSIAAAVARTAPLVVNKPGGVLKPLAGTNAWRLLGFTQLAGGFQAPSGTLDIGGTCTAPASPFRHVAGAFQHNGGVVHFAPTVDGPLHEPIRLEGGPGLLFNDLVVTPFRTAGMVLVHLSTAVSIPVEGTLELLSGTVSNGAWAVRGNVRVGDGFGGGTSAMRFSGGGEQAFDLSGAVDHFDGDIILDKDQGAIHLLSDLRLDKPGQRMEFIGGTLLTEGHELLLGDDVLAVGASAASFVDGPVSKVGDDAFQFPIGNSIAGFAPLSISAPTGSTSRFKAMYYPGDVDPMYPRADMEPGLDHVSACEYWTLDRVAGTAQVAVTLSWAERSCGVTSPCELQVVRWNGSQWTSLGNGGTTGTSASGTVRTGSTCTTAATTAAFGVFTLASVSRGNPLPVELLRFNAFPDGKMVQLEWATASETDNAFFLVERTVNGTDVTEVVRVPGAGNSQQVINYAAVDPAPYPGLTYYRLVQVDQDGMRNPSGLVPVHFQAEVINSLRVAPNPVERDPVTVFIHTERESRATVEVRDGMGRVVRRHELGLGAGMQQFRPEGWELLPPGIYVVHVDMGHRVLSSAFIVR